jgi:KDO2-lipid IV(A) lauroyltransferase
MVGLAYLAGVRRSLKAASRLGRIGFIVDRRHRRRALDHLRLAFATWGEDRITRTARRSCERFVQLGVEMLFMPRNITEDNYEKHLVRVDPLGALDMFHAREPMVLVTGHFGNWEAIGYFFSLEGHAIAATARPIDNPLINDWLLGIRRSRGMNVIEKWDNADVKIVKALQNREAVGFIADQNGGERGVFVPFFGRLASTPKTVGLLAMNMNVPVVCGYARRIEQHGLKYEIAPTAIIRPEDWADRSDPLFYITARYVSEIEKMVRKHPDDYMWAHRRWRSRPRFERQGKPMPDSFRRKLRELPWVDEALLAQLEKPLGFEP